MNDPQELRVQLAQKNLQLQQIAAQLKTELFGIDPIIDRVIDSVRAWYVLPELVSRPVIVCLWGLTGTGKTQLVRRLARLLGFYDRFVEVQMDGFFNGASWRGAQSISRIHGQLDVYGGAAAEDLNRDVCGRSYRRRRRWSIEHGVRLRRTHRQLHEARERRRNAGCRSLRSPTEPPLHGPSGEACWRSGRWPAPPLPLMCQAAEPIR
jgi:hypothetical protein